jgi:competence protein ComEC
VIGLLLGLAFLAGVLAYDLGLFPLVAAASTVAVMLLAVAWPAARVRMTLVALLACLLAGAGRLIVAPQREPLAEIAGVRRLNFTGIVTSLPKLYPDRTTVQLRLRTPVEVLVLAHLPPIATVRQGDLLRGTGTIERRERLAASSGSGAVLLVSRFIVEANASGPAERLRARVHEGVGERLLAAVPEPAGTLALGILLGDDSRMTHRTRQAFQTAGLTHLTAVSGWNVAVVAGICELALRRWLGARQRLLATAGVIWGYAYLVGMQPPVVRASLMGSLYLVARWRGRPREPLTVLVWSAVAMVVVRPEIRFDPAFQLSALTTGSLALLMPHIGSKPVWLGAISVPVAAQLAALPLLLFQFGVYSLLAPVANVLAGPAVSPVMASSVLVVSGSFVHPVVADLFGLLTWVPARWIVWLAEVASTVSGLSGRTLSPSAQVTALVYLGMAVPALWWWHRASTVPLREELTLMVPEARELSDGGWSSEAHPRGAARSHGGQEIEESRMR